MAYCFWSVVVAWSRSAVFAVAPRGGGGRAARVMGPWILGRGFESHCGGLESGVTARGGKVPGQALVPQLNYPPRREDRIKTHRVHLFLGVCVCGTSLLSRIVKCFSFIVNCIYFIRITLLCVSLPIVNKYLLNVPVRCLSFQPLTQHVAY